MPRRIDSIIVHCSDSLYGNAALIDEWHKARGWDGIGYHYVILNGYPTEESFRLKRPQFWLDGARESARPVERMGAHAKGYNATSVGICLIGVRQFTMAQFETLVRVIGELKDKYQITQVLGHYEVAVDGRSCPNLDMDFLRERFTSDEADNSR